ncbi:MAG: hypothetical protein Q4D82_01545 [Neisseria sp.]|nr:hypothetical protein [Neisseria sp.]
MAGKRKTRKKYNPRKQHRISGEMNLIHYMQAKNCNDDLPQGYINDYGAVIDALIDDLRFGRFTRQGFLMFSEITHFYGHLLLHLRPMRFSEDEQENLLLKLTLSTRLDFLTDTLQVALTAMTERFDKIGRFVATGEDLKLLERFRKEFIETLGFIRQRDFMAAYDESERVLRECPHRTGRFKEMKGAAQ